MYDAYIFVFQPKIFLKMGKNSSEVSQKLKGISVARHVRVYFKWSRVPHWNHPDLKKSSIFVSNIFLDGKSRQPIHVCGKTRNKYLESPKIQIQFFAI
jgi:hypothetical protein